MKQAITSVLIVVACAAVLLGPTLVGTAYGKWTMRDRQRVVVISDAEKHYDAPAAVNAWFACSDINSVQVKVGTETYAILYAQEPWTGHVSLEGARFSCAAMWTPPVELGTIGPGEQKSFTIELPQAGR